MNKRSILIVTSLFLQLGWGALMGDNAYCQQLDSLRYQYGYLYWHAYGKEGPPLILLSGGPGNEYTQIEAVALRLAKRHRVIIPEQRGTGRSIPARLDSTTINVAILTNDIASIMDKLKLQLATLIGHSWGAMLAINFVGKFPTRVSQLVLLSPGPYREWDKNFAIIHHQLRTRLGRNELGQFDRLLALVQQNRASTEDIDQYRRLFRSAYLYNKAGLDSIYSLIQVRQFPEMQQLILKDLSRHFDLTDALKRFQGKIHIICGREDLMAFNTYEIQLLKKEVSTYWIEEAGHFPMYEQPERFYTMLETILAKP